MPVLLTAMQGHQIPLFGPIGAAVRQRNVKLSKSMTVSIGL
jgi:hypothetical protein